MEELGESWIQSSEFYALRWRQPGALWVIVLPHESFTLNNNNTNSRHVRPSLAVWAVSQNKPPNMATQQTNAATLHHLKAIKQERHINSSSKAWRVTCFIYLSRKTKRDRGTAYLLHTTKCQTFIGLCHCFLQQILFLKEVRLNQTEHQL